MIRFFLLALVALFCAPQAAIAQVVTAPSELVDNDGDRRVSLASMAAKVLPPQKRGTVVRRCPGVPGFTYAVEGTPCPQAKAASPALVARSVPIAAPVRAFGAIAAPRITTEPRNFGGSGQWTYASAAGAFGNVHITRAMVAAPLRAPVLGSRVIHDVRADLVREFISTAAKSGRHAKVDNVTVRRIDVTAGKRGIYLRGGSANWLVEDFRIRGVGVNRSTGDIPVGVGVNGGHITLRRGEISGFRSDYGPNKYSNADCLSGERGDTITATDLNLRDCTDAAIDTKATTYLDRIVAENIEQRSYRFWAEVTAGDLTSIGTPWAHVWAGSHSPKVLSKARVIIGKLTAIGGGVLINVMPGAVVDVKSCDLTRYTGGVLVKGKGDVTLGTGCKLPS